jgi:hypothetical protein
MRASLRAAVFLLALLGVGLVSSKAHAYAWMIRHGFAECGSCHVDPMGGETLTGMGRVIGQTLMAAPWSDHPPTDVAKFAFGITEPDDLRLGGSFRALGIYDFDTDNVRAFPMQMDLYGAAFLGRLTVAGSVGYSRASRRYEHSSKAKLFGNIDDEGFLVVSRNHWLGYTFNDDLMLRAGRINLPFGVRTPDHTVWARAETQTDRESDQQYGVSLVYSASELRGELMAVVGNFAVPRENWEQGYSGYLEYSLETNLALGISSSILRAQKELVVDQEAFYRHGHGLTARWAASREWVVLAEADMIKRTGAGIGYVGFATLDFEPIQGFHLALTPEVLNRGKPSGGGADGVGRGDPRLGSWLTVNWFFMPHGDLRFDMVLREKRPAMLQAQIHFYL